MKRKIILALTACLFAAGSIINMHLAQNDQNTDISLADISVMAQADGESGGDNGYCYQDYHLGGLFTITPCVYYGADWSPPYVCGTPMSFCSHWWNGALCR